LKNHFNITLPSTHITTIIINKTVIIFSLAFTNYLPRIFARE
jgi:hypothetical protein